MCSTTAWLAPVLVPALLSVPTHGADARAQDLLRTGISRSRPAATRTPRRAATPAASAYFNAVWRQVLARTFDELLADRRPDGGDRWWLVVSNLLTQPDSPWWDDCSTAKVEHRDDILAASMERPRRS